MTLVATKAAFAALGIDAQETPAEDETESAPNDTEDAGEEPKAQRKAKSRASRTAAPCTRDGSKQAQLIAMLRRTKGPPSMRSRRRSPGSRTPCAARSPGRSRRSSDSMCSRIRSKAAGASTELLSDQPGGKGPPCGSRRAVGLCYRHAILHWLDLLCCTGKFTEAYCNETRRTEA